MSALDQLNSQYRELLDTFGDKTDTPRHLIEAEIMKLAAEVWQKPAVLDKQAEGALGRDSDGADSAGLSPKVNTQTSPQGTFSDTSTEADTETDDPGSFDAPKPKAQHPASDQSGTSAADTDLGADSDTGDNKTTKKMDSVSKSS